MKEVAARRESDKAPREHQSANYQKQFGKKLDMKTSSIRQAHRHICTVLWLALPLSVFGIRSDEELTQGQQPVPATSKTIHVRTLSADQLAAGQAAKSANVHVEWHSRSGVPITVRGADLGQRKTFSGGKGLALQGGQANEKDAIAVMDNVSRLYRVKDAEQEFTLKRIESDSLGHQHVRLHQRYRGLRVFGGEVAVHFGQNGKPYEVSGNYVPDFQLVIEPRVEGADAARKAQENLAARGKPAGALAEEPALVVFAHESDPRLAFEILLAYDDSVAGPGRWRYWVDALNGEVILGFNDIKAINPPSANGTAATMTGNILAGENGASQNVSGWRENTGVFYLYNPSQHWLVYNVASSGFPDNTTYAYRPSSAWGSSDPVEMSLARNFDTVQRYYREVHGRNSFNNSGILTRVNAHVPMPQYGNANAYWNPTSQQFYFADGNGTAANPLAVLDVCAHEFTHAVTEYTAGLIYFGESGALNESFSDVFGTAVEFHAQQDGRPAYPAKSPGAADWLVGEDCWLSSTALRDMQNPRNTATVGTGGVQPSRYLGSYWHTGSGDSGGVHRNSGVQNFFFYLLCEGGSGNNDGISYSVNGIGIANAERVAYRALTVYCTPNTDYQGVRAAWISAALDLNSTWAASVSTAWSAVGVGAPIALPVALDTPGLPWSTGGSANWTGQTIVSHDGNGAASSGAIRDNQESSLLTTVTGPGTLTFWWKVSSEANYDYLRVEVDGTEAGKISGEVDWQQRTLAIASGSHTIRWRYTKDPSIASGADRGWVDQVAFTALPVPNTVHVDWHNSNPGPDGTLAKPYPTLTQAVTAVANGGSVKVRAGSYAYPARILNKPQRLEAYDGRVIISASGARSVSITEAPLGELSPPLRQADGSMAFHFTTLQGVRYQVQTSTNLVDWEVWKDFTAEEETAELVAPDATTEAMRFFRVIAP